VIVSVNGVTLQEGSEYANDTTIPISNIRNRTFKLFQRLTSKHADVVTIAYYRNPNSERKLIKEDFQYTGSTNITYNPTTLKYEIEITNQRTPNSDIAVYWNGILLAKDMDYQVSVFNQNIIVLSSGFILTNPSVFSVFYFTNTASGQIIQATGPTYQINWSIQNQIPTNVTGNFTHEFYEITNTGLTGNTFYSIDTSYNYVGVIYSQLFNWEDIYPDLIYGTSYFYRIASKKYFKTINNISLSSVTYSQTYIMNIPS
jgi:hypothetical protein